ncbi:response regulator transcription factor [Marinicella sp. S1101]|uniref:response regulator n=1 Tax=Marinicella marina TaxID=2996016 RepID=UPI002260D62D|nr:response regulator transcription factor [Marinicella marina]MCX7554920.1 response regulator transcription factor [Marinicella marina]MDJ1141256.1 response regulator transcription factor [Marinicella marina]
MNWDIDNIAVDKIIIADDHPMFRNALRGALNLEQNGCQIIEAESSDTLRVELREHHDADLLILDLNMPGVEGFSALAFVQKKYPDLPIIMISANDKPETIMHAKHFGALGFVSKSASIEDIRKGLNTVLKGDIYFPYQFNEQAYITQDEGIAETTRQVAELTPQQLKVLGMIKQGLLNKQIAYDLDISEATVKAHVTAIMRKLEVNNRTQAVMKVANIDMGDA